MHAPQIVEMHVPMDVVDVQEVVLVIHLEPRQRVAAVENAPPIVAPTVILRLLHLPLYQ